MTHPVRLRLSRARGFDLQAHSRATNGLACVNVARPTKWGNPFKIGAPSGYMFNDGGDPTPMIAALTREQCLEFYADMITGFLSPEMHPAGHKHMDRWRRIMGPHFPIRDAALSYLQGRNLACSCKLDEPCHADILLAAAANRPICEAAE